VVVVFSLPKGLFIYRVSKKKIYSALRNIETNGKKSETLWLGCIMSMTNKFIFSYFLGYKNAKP